MSFDTFVYVMYDDSSVIPLFIECWGQLLSLLKPQKEINVLKMDWEKLMKHFLQVTKSRNTFKYVYKSLNPNTVIWKFLILEYLYYIMFKHTD